MKKKFRIIHKKKFTNELQTFNDAEKALYEKQQKMVDSIYEYADSVYRLNKEKEFVKEYYRCLLHAIYYRTGRNQRHCFMGIITNVVERKKYVNIYLMNVYWMECYISHHIVIKIPYDEFTDEIESMEIGDFVNFTALIEEYPDSEDYGLTGFKITHNAQLNKCKSTFTKVQADIKIKDLELGEMICGITDYNVKVALYHYLRRRIESYSRKNPIVPYDFYNTMIHGLYYRQQKEHDLHSQIFRFVPFSKDLDEIIPAQLFVIYMQEVHNIQHPGYILKCMVQFILHNTESVESIAIRINAFTDTMRAINDLVFEPIKEKRIYYNDDHISSFNIYFLQNDLFDNFNDEVRSNKYINPTDNILLDK